MTQIENPAAHDMIGSMNDVTIAIGLLILVVAILAIAVGVLFEKFRSLRRDLDALRSESAARNSAIRAARTHHAPPGVDARARTTRRDTDDLPLTGRMSQGVKRVRTDARSRDDDRLPPGPGPSAP